MCRYAAVESGLGRDVAVGRARSKVVPRRRQKRCGMKASGLRKVPHSSADQAMRPPAQGRRRLNGHRQQIARVIPLAILAMLAACTIKQIPPTTPPLANVAGGKRVVQLPTVMAYESVFTGEALADRPPNEGAQSSRIDAGIRTRLEASGVAVVAASSDQVTIRSHYQLLVGPRRDKAVALPALREIAANAGTTLAIVPLVVVRVGGGGGYDGNSGAIWTATSSTSVRLALVSLETGDRLWFREAFMRSAANDRDLARALDVAFRE